MVRRRKTAVTTCPTNSGRYPLYSTNLPHFFSRVRYPRKVRQVVTRGRLPPMSRRFVCPTNRLEKWDNGGTCSLLWDTFAGARLPERLPAPAPPCVIPHRRPARAAGGGRSPRRRAAAIATATASPTPWKRAPAPVFRNGRPADVLMRCVTRRECPHLARDGVLRLIPVYSRICGIPRGRWSRCAPHTRTRCRTSSTSTSASSPTSA